MQLSLGPLIGQWLEILRKLSCQKVECGKAPFCNIQGMSKVSNGMLHGTLQISMIYISIYVYIYFFLALNFHLIWSKTLPMNDFELTVPDLYNGMSIYGRMLASGQSWVRTTLHV